MNRSNKQIYCIAPCRKLESNRLNQVVEEAGSGGQGSTRAVNPTEKKDYKIKIDE